MIGVLVSGEGTNLQALIDGGLPIAAVASNRRSARALARAETAGIATGVFDAADYESREDRDEAIPPVKGYRPFRQVADTLARRGIATLRMDDRSFGESGGDARTATSDDFAQDIESGLAYLRKDFF